MGNWVVAVILGIVEGLTEFIPVSSTGHLIIAGNLLGFVGEKASTFEVAIQLGAILSVVVLYRERFLRLIPNNRQNYSPLSSALDGWSGLVRIGLATLPALIVGFLLRKVIKTYLFTPQAVAAALLVGGIAILLVERQVRRRPASVVDTLSLGQALGIGLFQTLALWPGTSRSAATILGGMLLGLDRKGAAEFSFLIAVPVMAAATGYDLLKMNGQLSGEETAQLALGFIVAFIVALATISWFLRVLNRWTLSPFAWYRIAVAPLFYLIAGGPHL
ncbi:MAG TPA: undecaprenyl-diphosphate phosphatase [Candidatus Binatia bacterium]|nr:undecaprenyl-diphosphate phosphatase [Candidatus Binatia bacterium]